MGRAELPLTCSPRSSAASMNSATSSPRASCAMCHDTPPGFKYNAVTSAMFALFSTMRGGPSSPKPGASSPKRSGSAVPIMHCDVIAIGTRQHTFDSRVVAEGGMVRVLWPPCAGAQSPSSVSRKYYFNNFNPKLILMGVIKGASLPAVFPRVLKTV